MYFPKILDIAKTCFIYFILDTEINLFVDLNTTIENFIMYCIMWEICKQHLHGGETLLNSLKLLYQIDRHNFYCLTWMMSIKKEVCSMCRHASLLISHIWSSWTESVGEYKLAVQTALQYIYTVSLLCEYDLIWNLCTSHIFNTC